MYIAPVPFSQLRYHVTPKRSEFHKTNYLDANKLNMMFEIHARAHTHTHIDIQNKFLQHMPPSNLPRQTLVQNYQTRSEFIYLDTVHNKTHLSKMCFRSGKRVVCVFTEKWR